MLIKMFKNKVEGLLLTVVLGAAIPAAQAMELERFVTESIVVHPAVLEKIHIYRQVDQDRDVAGSGWLPSVDLEASVGTYETESPATGFVNVDYESTRAELAVTQNLFNGFDTSNQIDQTDSRASSAMFEVYDTADNLALEAVQAYIDALKQRKLLELAEYNVSSHERILAQIRDRNNSGVGRRSELQQTEGRVARAHASLIAQQNNLQDSLTQLHHILGRYVAASDLHEPGMPEHPAYTLEDMTDIALENHPAVLVAQHNIDAALADSRRSRHTNYPRVDLRLAKEIGEDINGITGDTDELSLVLNLSYNLYRGGADRAEQRKKVSAVHEHQEFSARVRRQTINTLRLAWMADQSLTRQLIFLDAHIIKARQTVESYGEEFFIGQRDLIDLLDAENELNNAQNQFTVAYYDAFAARYRMMEAAGMLFPVLNMEVAVGDHELEINELVAQGEDALPLEDDRDADRELDVTDHCDNSASQSAVNDYGCIGLPAPWFGYGKANSEPVPGDDRMEIGMNSVLVITQRVLLENDTDPDSDVLRVIDFTQPLNGTLAFDSNKNLIYKANDGFTGDDSFSYSVTDGQGAIASGSVFLNIRKDAEMQLSNIQYVNFIYKSTDLTDASKQQVEGIVTALRSVPYSSIEVYAHTDAIGSDSYNRKLSDRRANAVRDLLVSYGFDGSNIRAFGMGERNPIADNSTPEGRAINRRCEILYKVVSEQDKVPDTLLEKNPSP